MSIRDIKKILRSKRKILEQEYNIRRIGIFGSYARAEATKKSDLDILVQFLRTPDIFQFIQLERYLSELIGIKVDLATPKALKPLLKKRILEETVYL